MSTFDDLRAITATTVDVPTAGWFYDLSERTAYELARRGEFPVPVLRLGRTCRVRTADLLRDLDPTHDDGAPASAPHVPASPISEDPREYAPLRRVTN